MNNNKRPLTPKSMPPTNYRHAKLKAVLRSIQCKLFKQKANKRLIWIYPDMDRSGPVHSNIHTAATPVS